MRNQIRKSVSVALVFGAFALLASCNGRQQSSEKVNQKEIEKDVKEVVYPIPVAFELTEMINRIGAGYIISITNPAENAKKYLTEKKQALNLGIYSTDLSYASTYRQQAKSMSYLKASKSLVEELNISGALDPNMVENIEKSADDKDKLVKIISESFINTYKYLQKNDRGGVSTIIMTGSWVEGLYIATHISEYTANNAEMVKIVLSQKKSLEILNGLLEKDLTNADVKAVYEDLKPLKVVFDSVDEKEVTDAQLKAIQEAVKTLRNKITA